MKGSNERGREPPTMVAPGGVGPPKFTKLPTPCIVPCTEIHLGLKAQEKKQLQYIVYVCACACAHTCVRVCMCMCMCIYMYIYNIYIYIYIYVQYSTVWTAYTVCTVHY